MQKNIGPEIGFVEWFAYGEREKVEMAVRDMQAIGIKHLRILFSWAEWEMPGGQEWFDWFVPKLGQAGIELFPSLFYTPIPKARLDHANQSKVSYPPKRLSGFAEFCSEMIRRYGQYFEWMQIWNEPNWKVYWDDELDNDFQIFAEMARQAAITIHKAGKKTILGGLMPYEAPFITRMHEFGVLEHMDAITLHHANSWPDRARWYGWQTTIANARAVLAGHNSNAQVWIAETGVSTFSHDLKEHAAQEQEQIRYFQTLQDIPAERIYWIFLYDQAPERLTDDAINLGVEADPVAYHFGIKKADGSPKPLFDFLRRQTEQHALGHS